MTGQFFQSAGSSDVALGVGASVETGDGVVDGGTDEGMDNRIGRVADWVADGEADKRMEADGVDVGAGGNSVALEFDSQAEIKTHAAMIKNSVRLIV